MKKRKIYREPTVEGIKPRIKSMIWNKRKKKHSIRTARRKKNYYKTKTKNKVSLRKLWTSPTVQTSKS